MDDLIVMRDGLRIYGKIAFPKGEGPFPLVVFSHGFGASRVYDSGMGDEFTERSIAFAAFDFCGGGPGSQSDGSMLDMSVLTEAADLNAVLDYVRGLGKVDVERVFLMGSSQGGYVSSCVAAERPCDIRGLVLNFPAFCIGDDALARLSDAGLGPESIPEQTTVGPMTVGRRYVEDAISVDVYARIADYPGDVLIVHGAQDQIVPLRYSQKAAAVYGDRAQLVVLDGMGHGFRSAPPECFRRAMDLALEFVEQRL